MIYTLCRPILLTFNISCFPKTSKVLAINVDSRLNFNQHISYISLKKAVSGINALAGMSTCLYYTAKICFYEGLL